MNTIFINNSGQGEPLLVIHGWGMNHNVWAPVKEKLEQHFTVSWMDLPGHGNSHNIALGDLDKVVDQIASQLEGSTHVMGWSLGGLIAQRLAERFPTLVRSLILVATTPSFVQRDSWQAALAQEVLQGFVENLQNDFSGTIKRFIALQFMGVKGVQATQKQLRKEILQSPPAAGALRDGLEILKSTDLRDAAIACPRHWIFGSLDKLIPAEAAAELQKKHAGDSFQVMAGTGHAPFISQPEEFADYVVQCINDGNA